MAKKSKKSSGKSLEKLHLEHDLRVHKIDGVVSVINTLIKFGCIGVAFGFAYLMIDALAGKETMANIGVSWLFESRTLAFIFGAGGIAYGVYERKLRQKTVKRFQPRIQELEQLLDPKRSSSLLTESGETNPDDQ